MRLLRRKKILLELKFVSAPRKDEKTTFWIVWMMRLLHRQWILLRLKFFHAPRKDGKTTFWLVRWPPKLSMIGD